ncbi:MAG: NAD(P)/FAD-dependent oxidoreductase [Hyphomicrobiaceae bacterium]
MRYATFPSYPDRCGWNALLPARQPTPAARGTLDARCVIVGAGFTGLAAARRLAGREPGADVVVLEATTVGEGSSARNSGFLSREDIPGSSSAGAVTKTALRNRYETEAFDDLSRLISQNGIDCDLEQTGRIKGAATAGGEASVRDMLSVVQALNIPHALLDTGQLRERIGTSYYRLGLFTGIGHLVQPAALIRGLADTLPPAVRLYEQSPVVTLSKRGKWHLETPDARISADIVILATNASVASFGYLRDRVVTIYTYAAITRPMAPVESAAIGAMPAWGLLPAHRLGTTLRRVGEDRLLIRSLYAYERGLPPAQVETELRARFHRRYPELGHVGFDHVWGGTTALTMNGAPAWGKLDDGLYASAGCNGAGIVKGTVLGRCLADFICGEDVEPGLLAAYGSASWIAPEPFRTLGFKAVSAIERRKAGREN